MKLPFKRFSFFALAVAIGGVTFGLIWLPEAAAATCASAPATMCYKGSTINKVAVYLQSVYLANGGYCGKCKPVSGT